MNTIKQERRWCVRDARKIPFVGFNSWGKSNDRSTWLSYAEAETLLIKYPDTFSGLGLFFSAREGNENLCLCGIDIDAIDHAADSPNPLADEILNLFRGTYAEKSPSGTGYHIICNINLDNFPYSREWYPFYEKNPHNSVEVYVGGITNRYFTFTGQRLETHSAEVTDQTENVLSLLQKYMKKENRLSKNRLSYTDSAAERAEPRFSPDDIDQRLDMLRQSAKGARFTKLYDDGDMSGFPSPSEAEFALLILMTPWLEGDPGSLDSAFRQSALYKNGRDEKWDSRRGSSTYGARTIFNAIQRCPYPYFSDSPDYATGDKITPEAIVAIINEIQNDEANKDKVAVVPFACGLGKSTAISYKIAEVLRSGGTDGLIIVTDSVERMYQYAAPANEKLASLKEYIQAHNDEISVLEKNTYAVEIDRQHSCRILIMSTQRYFQQLSRDQVISFTEWADGRRPLIIIDEQPIVLEQRSFDIFDLNAAEVALRKVNPVNESYDEQDWCVQQWQKVVAEIKDLDRHYRRLKAGSQETYYFLQNGKLQMTDDDTRFMQFIDTHNYAIYEKIDNKTAYSVFRAVHEMMTSWGLVQRRPCNNTIGISFHSVDDHKDKIVGIGAKVIILDGTAMLSPEYSSPDFFTVYDSPACCSPTVKPVSKDTYPGQGRTQLAVIS